MSSSVGDRRKELFTASHSFCGHSVCQDLKKRLPLPLILKSVPHSQQRVLLVFISALRICYIRASALSPT